MRAGRSEPSTGWTTTGSVRSGCCTATSATSGSFPGLQTIALITMASVAKIRNARKAPLQGGSVSGVFPLGAGMAPLPFGEPRHVVLRLPGEEGQPELRDAVLDRPRGSHVGPLVEEALLAPDGLRAQG